MNNESKEKIIDEILKKPRRSKKDKKILTAVALIIGTIGITIIIKTIGWLAALGIFLLLWGNNISQDKT